MAQQAPEIDQRMSELQSQLDRLSVSLVEWQQAQDRLQPIERRLSELTEHGAEMLDTWTTLNERHQQAVAGLEARLSDLDAVDNRLQLDAARRLQELARIIENEWQSLRQIHQAPVNELRDQAANLTEVSLAAASAAQNSFDRAEARLSALESTLHEHLAELSRQVYMAITDLRPRPKNGGPWPAAAGAAPAWPLDGVMRLHNQLREGDPDPAAPAALAALTVNAGTPAGSPALLERVESLERTLDDERTAIKEATAQTRRAGWTGLVAVVLAVLGFAAAGGLVWWVQRQIVASTERAAVAERDRQQAIDEANQRIAAARSEAAREAAVARDAAARAQTVGGVLAAPDLFRVLLSGGQPGSRFTGQLLWSRSRGLVFSTSRLPPAPQGSTYQLWLLTVGGPVSVGAFAPDAAGRGTIALDNPPRPAGAVTGAIVTLEQGDGAESPGGPTILEREP